MEQLPKKKASILSIVKDYKLLIFILLIFTLASNLLTLLVPKLISRGIDNYTSHTLILKDLLLNFSIVVILIFIFSFNNFVSL